MIDLRSDTVTKPNEPMRKAMYNSEVGDDVYGEDPTVNKLQDMVSEITGMEDSLLVASGTMGNLVSLLTLTNRGEEIILGNKCHVYAWEGSGVSIYGGISMKIINNKLTTLSIPPYSPGKPLEYGKDSSCKYHYPAT